MNDNDIIKALEVCAGLKGICSAHNCPAFGRISDRRICAMRLKRECYDLIARQKAENEALKLINSTYEAETDTIRSIAFQEFAEGLKARARMPLGTLYGRMVRMEDIDNLVKEMTEEKK